MRATALILPPAPPPAAYCLLDILWLHRRASYMEFPHILAAVRQRLDKSLASRRAQTLGDLQMMLLQSV